MKEEAPFKERRHADGIVDAVLWVALLGILVPVGFAIHFLLNSTIYISRPFGFRAIGTKEVLEHISGDRYERILDRLVKGDLFDYLHVSLRDDDHGGIALSHQGDQIEMTCSFLRLKHPDRVSAFRDDMQSLGYTPTDEHPWNVGMGEDSESVTLTYRTVVELDLVQNMAQQALEFRDGEPLDGYFVQAWRSQDGPGGVGVKIVRRRNILDQVR